MAAFWRDFSDEVFSLDRGLLWTFWQLLANPGQLIRRHVDQRDPRITRPVRYYLVGFLLLAVVFKDSAPLDFLEDVIRNRLGDIGGGAAVWAVLQHMTLLALVTVVPAVACGLRIAYASHGPTFAEMWVFALFVIAQLFIYWAMFSIAMACLQGMQPEAGIFQFLPPVFIVVPVACLISSCLGYFPQPGAGRALRAILATALGMALIYAFSAAILVGAFQIGKHWPGLFVQ